MTKMNKPGGYTAHRRDTFANQAVKTVEQLPDMMAKALAEAKRELDKAILKSME